MLLLLGLAANEQKSALDLSGYGGVNFLHSEEWAMMSITGGLSVGVTVCRRGFDNLP